MFKKYVPLDGMAFFAQLFSAKKFENVLQNK
jgi:hypothetical protein